MKPKQNAPQYRPQMATGPSTEKEKPVTAMLAGLLSIGLSAMP